MRTLLAMALTSTVSINAMQSNLDLIQSSTLVSVQPRRFTWLPRFSNQYRAWHWLRLDQDQIPKRDGNLTRQAEHKSSTVESNANVPLLPRWKRFQHFSSRQRPIFDGNGLLISAGAGAFAVLGSGIALPFLYPQKHRICEPSIEGGEEYCYTDQKYLEWEAFSVMMFTTGTIAATTLGIAGSVLRGHYDAWRVKHGTRRPVSSRRYFALGGSLIGLSGTMIAASVASYTSYRNDKAREVAAPLFGTASVLTFASGISCISYGISYLVRTRRLKSVSASPFVQLNSQVAGLSIRGRF